MTFFIEIFLQIIFPILLLLALGAFLQRKFSFQLKQLSTLVTNCFMPAAIFLHIYRSSFDASLLGQLLSYLFIFTVALMIIGQIMAKCLSLNKGEAATLKNSISLMNSNNYGLPVSQLVFTVNPLGVSVQIIIIVVQNILTFTYGMYNLLSTSRSIGSLVLSLVKLPVIHALLLGYLFLLFNIPLPTFIEIPLDQLAAGFIGLALLLLGAQLSQIQLKMFHRVITWSLIGRLLLGPALSFLIITLLGIEGVLAQSLFIASAFPTSRNTATIALEYNVEPQLTAQIVLYSTLLSSLTVSLVIYLSFLLYV
ncbi:AEC family transporter [Cytobacillus sp. FSL W7-1323]|uniref:AEC family transporter n=1 Tax=Cytobacillus TaxID=2675230 RepID=UPI001CD5C487|nr:AEC family transporter [Cytobacillus kochii]MCA1024795.1 AEC family transporter [Cytobacillus kochii]MCM3323722.1 AEC family transporter [Cytobacillus kochii]MCM3346097.1 AEC family transporter [Cytobacillus kochii]MDM5206488.1 AEC family transporter [Cytobacillus kochii]